MSVYTALVRWSRRGAAFTDNRYSREHTWEFDGGVQIPASSSPHVVPVPMSNAANVDPEEGYVASLSSCHMLWFLSIAAKHGFVVEEYADQAEGIMEPNAEGRIAVTKVRLAPDVRFAGDHLPTEAQIQEMHHEAHENCYLANSVKTVISIVPPASAA